MLRRVDPLEVVDVPRRVDIDAVAEKEGLEIRHHVVVARRIVAPPRAIVTRDQRRVCSACGRRVGLAALMSKPRRRKAARRRDSESPWIRSARMLYTVTCEAGGKRAAVREGAVGVRRWGPIVRIQPVVQRVLERLLGSGQWV